MAGWAYSCREKNTHASQGTFQIQEDKADSIAEAKDLMSLLMDELTGNLEI